jgi:glycosyltransferase involved in cell wall biosynthesis
MADVLRALAHVRTRRPGIRAAIVGEGPLEAELRALAASLQLGDRVDFVGFRHDIENVYADARVFVLASASEGLPVAMLEAMSAGLPPVVSEVGETGGFVRNGENGFLFPPGDVEALAGVLETLLGDESLQEAVGLAAAREVRARVSVSAVAEGYREIFSAQVPRQVG